MNCCDYRIAQLAGWSKAHRVALLQLASHLSRIYNLHQRTGETIPPFAANGHLDIKELETWQSDTAGSIRGALGTELTKILKLLGYPPYN